MNEDSIDQHKAKLLNMKHVTVGQSGTESKCQREVLWHINVDFLEDRLHIGVSVRRKLGLRTAAGLSKSHKARLFVLTSKFLAECNNTENGHSSLNLNASCKSNHDQILARTVAAQWVRRSPWAQWALTARREWRTWTQHELGTSCSVPEASSLLLTSSF